MARLTLETGHGLAVPLKLCAFAHHSSDTVMSYAFTQQSSPPVHTIPGSLGGLLLFRLRHSLLMKLHAL